MRLPTLGPTFLYLSTSSLAFALLDSPPDSEALQLDSFMVAEVPIERSINPLTREPSSILGDGRNLMLTPRAASSLSTALFNERQIHGVREFVSFVPGAYASASYGKATVPNLRGDIAETFLNGQRLSYNLYGYFPSFNGVESLDVVRGPAGVAFGAGYQTGGYVNYDTKRPHFGIERTVVTTRLGTWAPGETNYLNGSVQIDTSSSFSDSCAWRLSYEAKGGETFFRRNEVPDDRQDLFLALSWRPGPDTLLDLNGQWLWQSSPEILGVNRVNQELIDRALYYTGDSANNSFPGPIPALGTVLLPRHATLFSKGDYSNAKVGRLQAILRHQPNPAFRFVNRSLYEYVDRHRYHAFEYAEWVTQHTAENRSEIHVESNLLGLPTKTLAGLSLRYEGRLSFANYFNEYFYNFDLTDPSRIFRQNERFFNSYWPGQPGPNGIPFFSPTVDSPETVRSETLNPGLFWQQDLALNQHLSAVVGFRHDSFWAKAKDPLPPDQGPFFRDAEWIDNHSQTYSLLYRPKAHLSFYLTHNRIHSSNGNLTGGGVILTVPDGQINRADFRNLSELFEVGARLALLNNQLYLASTLFHQDRTRQSLHGRKNNLSIEGIELETVFQPHTNLSFTFNATLQNGHYVESAPFQLGGRSIYDAYLLGKGPGARGTGTNDYNPWANQVPTGNWPLLGFSKVLANASLRYRWPNGWGLAFDAQWQSRQTGNLDNEWYIPAQFLLNGSLFFEARRWSVNLDLLNLSNERNWIHNGDAYTASQLIFAELPFRLEAVLKVRF